MSVLFVGGLIALNLLISAANAWIVGRSWAESKAMGGVARFMNWCGAIMSACGFTYVYTFLLALGALGAGKLKPEQAQALLSLGYLMIIVPVLGTGLAITVQSWAVFWRRRTFGSGAVSAWNTFAQVHNAYTAISAIPRALGDVGSLFDGDSDSSPAARLVLLLVALALVGGCLTTWAIAATAARSKARSVELAARRAMAGAAA